MLPAQFPSTGLVAHRGLAARFLVRTGRGIETRDTSAFRQLSAGESAAASFAYGIATRTSASVQTGQGS